MNSLAYRNGKLFEGSCLAERAFIYADGVFETMRARGDQIPLWHLHRKRLERASEQLHLAIDFQSLEEELNAVLTENMLDHAVVKLIVGRAGSARGSNPPAENATDSFVSIKPLIPKSHDASVELVCAKKHLPDHESFPGLKLLNRLEYIVAASNEVISDKQELLYLNTSGDVVETMHHNVFMLKGDVLISPGLQGFGVAGVLRDFVLNKLAPSLSLSVKVVDFSLDELKGSDAVFITNAVDGVVHVSAIDGEACAENKIVKALQHRLAEIYQ